MLCFILLYILYCALLKEISDEDAIEVGTVNQSFADVLLQLFLSGKIIGDLLCAEFQYDPDNFDVTPEMQEAFDWDGCFIVRYCFTAA